MDEILWYFISKLYVLNNVFSPTSTVRDMWSAEHRPREWPVDVPFVDPNNGKSHLLNVLI